jgi:monoterpene epsilon-lactone hydrolase
MKAFFALVMLFAMTTPAQQATTAAQAPNGNTSYIDENGTAHVTRVIPIPEDLSPEAKKSMSRRESDAAKPEDLALRRKMTDQWQNHAGEVSRKAYPVNLTNETMAGVPVRVMTPLSGMVTDRVLINLHGGGFDSDSGSLTESIPMANLTHMKVIAVLYRLAPEHPYPAAVEDAVAVYKEVLKKYRPEHIGVYGTSAGAILTSELAVRLKQLKLPLPGALGVFSGLGDLSRGSDSMAMYALNGLSGHLDLPSEQHDLSYLKTADKRDPVVSPLFADLHGMPPALFITSGRDLLLSGTSILHRAFLRAGNDAELIVFEGLPHAFWNDVNLPETKETYGYMSEFFTKKLGLKAVATQTSSR